MTTGQEDRRELLGNHSEELALRVRGTSRDGQVLRIKSARCSIGADPGCTIRLRGPGVQPVHCLILRGERGTALRRWSPDTRLNGQAFDDAWLNKGDRLSVGPFEFDVLDGDEVQQTTTPHTDATEETINQLKSQLDQQLREFEEQQIQWAAQHDEFTAARAVMDAELQELRQELLRQQAAAAQQSLEEIRHREQLWQEERSRLEAKLEELQQVTDERAQLIDRVAALEAERSQWQIERERLECEIAEQAAEPQAVQEAFMEAQISNDSHDSHDDDKSSFDAGDYGQPDEVSFQPLSESAPLDASAVLQGLGQTQIWDADVAEDTVHESSAFEELVRPAEATNSGFLDIGVAEEKQESAEDEESIEDYMSRLLNRVRGDEAEPAKSEIYRVPVAEPAPKLDEPLKPELPTEKRGSSDLGEFTPRSQAPERSSNMAAMRELANETTRRAIDTSDQVRRKAATVAKLILAGISLAIGIIVFQYKIAAPSIRYLTLFASAAVAIFFAFQSLRISSRRRRSEKDYVKRFENQVRPRPESSGEPTKT